MSNHAHDSTGGLFTQHLNHLLFIEKLQDNEQLFKQFSKNHGHVFSKGGGIPDGGGIPKANNGLNAGGMGKHHPAIQAEMLGEPDDPLQEKQDIQETEFENKKKHPEAPVTKVSIQGEIKSLTKTGGETEGTQMVPQGAHGVSDAQSTALKVAMRNYGEGEKKAFHGTSTRHVVLIRPDGGTYDMGSQAKASVALGMTKHALQGGRAPKNEFDHRVMKDNNVIAFVSKDGKKMFGNLKKYDA